jgi:hypothetical protein
MGWKCNKGALQFIVRAFPFLQAVPETSTPSPVRLPLTEFFFVVRDPFLPKFDRLLVI